MNSKKFTPVEIPDAIIAAAGRSVLITIGKHHIVVKSREPIEIKKYFKEEDLNDSPTLAASLQRGYIVPYVGQEIEANKGSYTMHPIPKLKPSNSAVSETKFSVTQGDKGPINISLNVSDSIMKKAGKLSKENKKKANTSNFDDPESGDFKLPEKPKFRLEGFKEAPKINLGDNGAEKKPKKSSKVK
jgi:hypothetical protein